METSAVIDGHGVFVYASGVHFMGARDVLTASCLLNAGVAYGRSGVFRVPTHLLRAERCRPFLW